MQSVENKQKQQNTIMTERFILPVTFHLQPKNYKLYLLLKQLLTSFLLRRSPNPIFIPLSQLYGHTASVFPDSPSYLRTQHNSKKVK